MPSCLKEENLYILVPSTLMNRIITIIVFVFAAMSCSAQSVCEKLQQLKQQYYGFKPTILKDKEREKRSADLDKFWDYAKSNKVEAAPCLSQMIQAEKNDLYFCFDASSLLLSIDEKQQYLNAVLEGLRKCDLVDLQLEPYLQITFFLGAHGKDIAPLAEKLISFPNAKIYLTQHALTLDAIGASLFLYNQMGTEKAERSLLSAVANGNATAKFNAAVVLTIISTAKGDSLINRLIAQKQLPDSTIKAVEQTRKALIVKGPCEGKLSRTEILQQLNNSPVGEVDSKEMICSAVKVLQPQDIEALRAARQKSMPGLSDEGLERYYVLTSLIVTLRNR